MRPRFCATFVLASWLLVLAVSASWAQGNQTRINVINRRLQQILKTYQKMPPTYQQLLDGGSNAAHIAQVLNSMAPTLKKNMTRAAFVANLKAPTVSGSGVVPVSNPATDLEFSAFAGFTQSETSTALCGNNVVVGFNDSGSLFETLISGVGGLSFSGVASSSNRGASFTDLGPVPPGSNPNNFLVGDPIIGCSDSSTFYYAQLFETSDASGHPITAVAVSKSTDGGNSWGNPVAAATKSGVTHFLDKDWMAVDPSNPQRIYVTYTDFDGSFTNPACPNNFRIAIEIVRSEDGGNTWSPSAVLDTVCGFFDALQGSHVVVGSNGKGYVAWEHFTNFPLGPREFRFNSFLPNKSFGPFTVIDAITAVGDTFFLQGEFRDFLGIDLNVDHSGGPKDGNLYATWDDGRDKSIPDLTSMSGFYSFADVLLRTSKDGGKTWGVAPVKVNSDSQPQTGFGHDHYQPGIAVDVTGKVGVCWYDRRDDPENFAIERFCGTSTDGGSTWKNVKSNATSFGPVHGIDVLINPVYMGDYDGLASDFTNSTSGFIGAFQVMGSKANPDVQAFSFQ